MFNNLYRFDQEGVIKSREMILEDIQMSIERLIEMGKITAEDLRYYVEGRPYIKRTGYRLTDDGLRVARRLPVPEEKYEFKPAFRPI